MNFKKVVIAIFSSCLLLTSAIQAKDNWVLVERNSHVNFYTVKKGSVGEAFSFFDFSGQIKGNNASVKILTDSLDTKVDIRNDRMKKYLFNVEKFPTIEVSADVEEVFRRLEKRSVIDAEVPAILKLHGVESPITLNVNIAKKGSKEIVVSTIQPIIIKAESYGLTEGLNKLSELVGSIRIASAVPVNFVLQFKSQ